MIDLQQLDDYLVTVVSHIMLAQEQLAALCQQVIDIRSEAELAYQAAMQAKRLTEAK